MTVLALGGSWAAAVLKPGGAIHGHHLDALAPCLITLLESLPGPAWDHVQQAGRLSPVAHGGQVDVHRDVPVAPPGVAPDVLIDAQGLDPREAVRILGDGLLGAGQWSGWFFSDSGDPVFWWRDRMGLCRE